MRSAEKGSGGEIAEGIERAVTTAVHDGTGEEVADVEIEP